MASSLPGPISRKTERLFLLLVSVVLAALFYQLFTVLQKDFKDIPNRIKNGTVMNLNDAEPGERIKVLLQRGFYFSDPRDIELISKVVARVRNQQAEPIDNVGELNKSLYKVSTTEARSGGESFKKRLSVQQSLLGFSDAELCVVAARARRPDECAGGE